MLGCRRENSWLPRMLLAGGGREQDQRCNPMAQLRFACWFAAETDSLNGLCGREHFICLGAYTDVFGEVRPSHRAGVIHQKLCRSGDVASLRTAADMQQVVSANGLRFGIGEERKRVSRFAAELFRSLRAIHANRYRTNTGVVELLQIFLNAS